MIVSHLKQFGISELRASEIESAILDSEVLLAFALGCRREQLISGSEREVPPEIETAFLELITRRKKHEPVAYLCGRREFYGREFLVTPAVLIPRPETEFVIEEALSLCRKLDSQEEILLIDIGTGSGAIVLTLLEELKRSFSFASVSAIAADISADALAVARENRLRLKISQPIDFIQSDLFQNVPAAALHRGSYALITANLPYIPNSERLPPDVGEYEPSSALRGGEFGLEIVQCCIEQVQRLEPCGRGSLILEIGSGQSEELKKIYPELFSYRKDLQGIERIVRWNYCGRCS